MIISWEKEDSTMSTGIYKFQNQINGHIYIGQSTDIERRYKQHLYDAKHPERPNTGIEDPIRKYGIENFSFSIIQLCEEEKLDEREIYWIAYYDSYYHGYNKTKGGKSLRGEDHPRAILTKQQVWDIREQYNRGIQRKKVFQPYLKKGITEKCLLKVWNGQTWVNIHNDVYTEENKKKHKIQTGHSEDQIGKSSLDRAISQNEINIWLQDYNNGLTINAIAKKYHRDNGTIERYINHPEAISEIKYRGRKVKNIETEQIFTSISSAAKWAGCGATTLSRHLTTDKTAGKVHGTQEPAHWIELS